MEYKTKLTARDTLATMSTPLEKPPAVLAVACHPDDIEFCFSGTLLLFRAAGCTIHMWNMANGSCGSTEQGPEETARIRWEEAQASAALAGATAHAPIFNDLEVFYDKPSLATASAVLREIAPNIILTHSSQDYMEDHQNVCRLVTTAAFSRGMPNFRTTPETACYNEPVRIYHAAPHGLKDALEFDFIPSHLIDVATVMEKKKSMLGCHQSQQQWLQTSQGMNAYISEMETMCATMATRKEGVQFAEGWRRHSHLGFCDASYDPMQELLKNLCHTNFN